MTLTVDKYKYCIFLFFLLYIVCSAIFSIQTQFLFVCVFRRICSVISVWIDQYPLDFDEPPLFQALTTLITFSRQRRHLPSVKELFNRCEQKLNTLSVSPFDDESKCLILSIVYIEPFQDESKCYIERVCHFEDENTQVQHFKYTIYIEY